MNLSDAAIGLVFAFAVAPALGAVMLRVAIGLSNRVAGGPAGDGVPPPSFARAGLIAVASFAITAVINGGALFAMTTLLDARSPDQLHEAYRLTGLLLLPVNVLILAV